MISGASECKICSPGKKCVREANSQMLPCEIGYECSNPAQPTKCPSGTNASVTGLSSCQSCLDGYNCFEPANPFICPAGSYVIDAASEFCVDCKAGHYCTDGIINPCGLGKYSKAESSACTDCEPGRKCTGLTMNEPDDCPIGYSCRDPAFPLFCPEGTLATQLNQIDCLPCPVHHSCIQPTKPVLMLATKVNSIDISNSSCFHHRILMKSKEFHNKEVIEVISEVSNHGKTGIGDRLSRIAIFRHEIKIRNCQQITDVVYRFKDLRHENFQTCHRYSL